MRPFGKVAPVTGAARGSGRRIVASGDVRCPTGRSLVVDGGWQGK